MHLLGEVRAVSGAGEVDGVAVEALGVFAQPCLSERCVVVQRVTARKKGTQIR